jgi:ureidoacrylate peracid hydrolase
VPGSLLVNIPRMTVDTTSEGKTRRFVTLPARPEPIRVAVDETAVIVVDMQNAYASPGGYLDLAGFDIGGAAAVVEQCARVVETARGAGLPILYFQNGWDEAYVEAGGPGSPNWHKSNALKTMRARPELQGKLLARGGWDYSGFFNSQLDSVLRSRGIRNIVLVGIATNVCVESTLRDGFFLEYFGIMLEDATHQAGPEYLQKASVYNVETFFGWVSTVADFCGAFGQIAGEP